MNLDGQSCNGPDLRTFIRIGASEDEANSNLDGTRTTGTDKFDPEEPAEHWTILVKWAKPKFENGSIEIIQN